MATEHPDCDLAWFHALTPETVRKLEKTEAEVKKFAHHNELFAWLISPHPVVVSSLDDMFQLFDESFANTRHWTFEPTVEFNVFVTLDQA